MDPIVIGLRQAAAMTGLSVDTLHRAIRRGALPAIRIGTRVVVRPQALEKFVSDHEVRKGRRGEDPVWQAPRLLQETPVEDKKVRER
jgi:excisionase family DNA binding protein